jgi:hypothetical protein
LPYATNPLDGVRTYFEDSGGAGPPVLFHISAFYEADEAVLPHVLGHLRAATGAY